jgi:hypothetical protein
VTRPHAPKRPRRLRPCQPKQTLLEGEALTKAIIAGAGCSGLGQAIALERAGIRDDVVWETADSAQNHTGARSHIRALRPLASAVAILFCACACASGAISTGAVVNRSTPGAVLTHYLHQIARGDYGAACQDMAGPLPGRPAPAPASATDCTSKSSVLLSTDHLRGFNALHRSFTGMGITPQSSITVAAAHVTGRKATVDGTDIHVLGTTLTSLMVAHSTGVQPGQFSISFELSRISGAWYVTGMDMSLGGAVGF